MKTSVQGSAAQCIDPGRNAYKFYRVAAVGNYAVVHWGRIGTRGQAQVTKCASPAEAHATATKKISGKVRKEYASLGDFSFDFTNTAFDPDNPRALLDVMEARANRLEGSQRRAPAATAPESDTATAVVTDRLSNLLDKARDVTGLVVDDPAQARVAYAELNQEFAEMEDDIERARSFMSTIDMLLAHA